MNDEQPSRTSEVIDRFNRAFQEHVLEGLIAEACVMESVDAPDGTRVVGRAANQPATAWRLAWHS